MAALQLRGVTKEFGGVTALHDLDLTVHEGEVFGFLGPNGAGKSTTINILLDYLRPTAGRVEVFGIDVQTDPVAARRRLGVLPEGFNVVGRMTGRDHVDLAVDSTGGSDDPDRLLSLVDLADVADRPAVDYSKGMRQRLALAMAIAGDPDMLVLDEPTTGLDPNAARMVRSVVEEFRADGAAVFFSSHVLEQVEAVADRVGILRDGKLVAVDSIDGLRAEGDPTGRLTLTLDGADAAEGCRERVAAVDGVDAITVDGREVTVTCLPGAKAPVVDAVRADGATVEDFRTSEPSLEELFARYT